MKKVCIFGAGAFAREVYATVLRAGFDVQYFVDTKPGKIYDKEIVTIDHIDAAKHKAVLAVGHPEMKLKILQEIKDKLGNIEFPNIIDPSAVLTNKNTIELAEGIVICPNSVLTCDIKIDSFVHINLICTVGHDCVIGKYSQFSPGVNISGNNTIGESVYFGTNSCSIEKVKICSNVTIGAGAVVSKTITEPGTYVGIPAKKMMHKIKTIIPANIK